MKLTVFGATGGTGQQLVRQALRDNHQVTAVVRNPDRLTVTDPDLRVVTASVDEPEPLRDALAGQDAVLSALGGTPPVAELGTRAILRAMGDAGVRRLVVVSAAPVGPTGEGESLLFRRVVNPLVYRVFRKVYEDLARMERLITESDTDWTVVRPPRLTDEDGTGRYRHCFETAVPRSHTVSRADLARAMLDFVTTDDTVRRPVGVAAG